MNKCFIKTLIKSETMCLVLERLFKKTLCVRYFTEMILGSFGNVPVNKNRQFVLAILLGSLRDHCVYKQ